jgi:DNA-binding MurR/RpiR family transcriptional regulator
MLSTVNALSSDVNSSIDFVLEGHQRACEVLSPRQPRRGRQAVALLSDARQVAIFGIGPRGFWRSTPPGCSAVSACRPA